MQYLIKSLYDKIILKYLMNDVALGITLLIH